MIVDYLVTYSVGHLGLIKNVNEYMKEGWQPLGGISMSPTPGTAMFAQALVKYAERFTATTP